MKKRELVTKILAGLLVAVMLIGLLPMFASATETNDAEAPGEGDLFLNKTAELQPDGTWTITLEAYATGSVQREVRTQVTPTDIILVLDQSGSMEQSSLEVPGTYQEVSTADLPTNATLESSAGYYFYDPQDEEFYLIVTEKVYTAEACWIYLDSAGKYQMTKDSAKIATSWQAGNSTVNFDGGTGYVADDYAIYYRSSTGNGRNRKYQFTYSSGKELDSATTLPTSPATLDAAKAALESAWGEQYQVAYSGNYALVYRPATHDYQYHYTYTDTINQVWSIGYSALYSSIADADNPVDITTKQYDAQSLGNIYTLQGGGNIYRLQALQNAATVFINDIQAAAAEHSVDHRIAVVGFSGNDGTKYNEQEGYEYVNSELFIGSNQYNYWDAADNTANNHAAQYYDQAFQSVNKTKGYNNLIASVNALEGYGPTFTSSGFLLAEGIAKENANVTTVTDDQNNTSETNDYITGKRKLVVVFMSDGAPGWSTNGSWGNDATDEASATISLANTLKTTYGATIYSVAMLSETPDDNEHDFLTAVSSSGIEGTNGNNYWLVKDGVSLANFFHSIEIEVDTVTSTVELSQNAFLVDRVSEFFNMPADITTENMKMYVSIYTVPYEGNGVFANIDPNDDGKNYEIAASVDTENTLSANKIHAWLTYGEDDGPTKGITVHNFDYLAPENMVTTVDGVATGHKLIVVIKGITANDSAAQDGLVPTNNDHSGLWDLNKTGDAYGMLEAFPMPYVDIIDRIYILDYAKRAKLDTVTPYGEAIALSYADDSFDGFFDEENNPIQSLSITNDADSVKFGTVSIDDSDYKVYYTPKTMQWDGYDSFYVLLNKVKDDDTTRELAKFSVMPANNVYYEDTFVSTKVEGEYVDSTTEGRVGIEFGSGWDFTTVEGNNTENPESAGQNDTLGTHGWVESLADDTGFTDGTVAVGSGNEKATATFTFTGTGVDIYSYTNSTVGTILVKVERVNVAENDMYSVPTRYFIVDNYAASGAYYQIPTVSYIARGTQVRDAEGNELTEPVKDALVHGTYKVTVTVTTAASIDNDRVTYYLDGIRVYNPLSFEHENDPVVGEGYGDEVHSFFYNIRDYLISEADFDVLDKGSGAVFIDQIKEGQSVDGTEAGADDNDGLPVTTIGTYEDYGPKNEVYLANGQMIVMKVDIVDGRRWFVSLKSPTGAATTAAVSHDDTSKATITVDHTSDLYYEVVPVNVTTDANGNKYGYIAIENTGTALLSVGKYQITGLDPNPHDNPDTTNAVMLLSIGEEEAVNFASTYARMASAPYSGTGTTGETESDANQETPAEPETPEVEITNPETETETPDAPSPEEQAMAIVKALVERLFKSVRDWFST